MFQQGGQRSVGICTFLSALPPQDTLLIYSFRKDPIEVGLGKPITEPGNPWKVSIKMYRIQNKACCVWAEGGEHGTRAPCRGNQMLPQTVLQPFCPALLYSGIYRSAGPLYPENHGKSTCRPELLFWCWMLLSQPLPPSYQPVPQSCCAFLFLCFAWRMMSDKLELPGSSIHSMLWLGLAWQWDLLPRCTYEKCGRVPPTVQT